MALFNTENLTSMYSKHKIGGEIIMLWCDGKLEKGTKDCQKWDSDTCC